MLALDRGSATPLYRQLYESLRSQILDGRLAARMRLPATRELANDLGVSRNTVIGAYDALQAEGYLESAAGSGTRVAALPEYVGRTKVGRHASRLPGLSKRGRLMTSLWRDRTIPDRIAFHPGYPEIQAFPFTTWARLVAANMRNIREDLFGYHLVAGHPRLRLAIAEYLGVSRGVNCEPDQIIVVTGAQAALDLIGRLFMDPGDCFWIEDPGYAGAYNAFVSAGGRPAPLPVGPGGWGIEKANPSPRLIFVTPSCQWPLGLVMPMEVRLRLLQIAEKHDAWIVEDDYDSEYRFRGHPIPAMQGLDDSGRVIYVGTLSKTMFPSVRVAYIVVPPTLVEGFKTAVSVSGQYPPLLLQAAVADFISQGFFAIHLRRMRRLYARRQREFVAMCNTRLDRWLSVREIDTGMQLMGRFKRPMDDGDVLVAAMKRGVDFSRMSPHYRFAEPEQGMFLGYAGVDQDTTRRGVERLRLAFQDLERGSRQG
ncbi:MAG: PLP-dependent aminotransferase family protein [Hyphomicrobiales bacterium]|nr:PLP-dependent aminotransferase family protein [Hyphomicrobiales bacterium]